MSAQEIRFHIPFANLVRSLASASRRVGSRRKMAPLDELIARPPAEPIWHAVRNELDFMNTVCGSVPPKSWRA
jgi:hypothetical protein